MDFPKVAGWFYMASWLIANLFDFQTNCYMLLLLCFKKYASVSMREILNMIIWDNIRHEPPWWMESIQIEGKWLQKLICIALVDIRIYWKKLL